MNHNKTHTKKSDLFDFFHKKAMFFKTDIIVLILLVALVTVSSIMLFNKKQGEFVDIYYKGQLIERHSLDEDKFIIINKAGNNQIRIENKKVYMYKSDCDNQICVKTGVISRVGQRIICAPNGIVIIITGKKQLDGITGGGDNDR